MIKRIKFLEVQFHEWYPTIELSRIARANLHRKLFLTHKIVYSYDFVYRKNGRGDETMMINNVKKIIKNLQWILNHRLVRGNKLRTIFRYFWFHLTIKKDGIFTYKILNQKLTIRKGHGSQTNYYAHLEDYNEMMFSLHYLNESDRFLDVGANVGVCYSILVASQKRSEVIAIEPMKKNYDLLVRNIKINNLSEKVTPINIGLRRRRFKIQI